MPHSLQERGDEHCSWAQLPVVLAVFVLMPGDLMGQQGLGKQVKFILK